MKNSLNLLGKNILVTGAGGLLGQEHCLALCQAEAFVVATDVTLNFKASLLSRFVQEEIPTSRIMFVEMDVTKEESILNAYALLQNQSIFIDTLVNNAAKNPAVGKEGMSVPSSRLEDFSYEPFLEDFKVGVVGAILTIKIFGKQMAKNGIGNIVNIGSDLGVIAPNQNLYKKPGIATDAQPVKPVSYSVIKHGIVGLTKYVSTYWKNVRCNCLSPGGVFANQPPSFVENISQLIPLGRMAHTSEYRGTLVYLCSDASSYMNGANLIVDGGRTAW
jgi:NAD(P)-dependent dehydrogenase (short-subunit alcohol dehydrogenase family)